MSGYVARTLLTVSAIVLVWRGIWHLLDKIDESFFGGSHWWTSLIGVIAGIVMLYLPEKNLRSIEKL